MLLDRYNALGSYRAVAEECDSVVSPAMVRKVVLFGQWSPKLARHLGLTETRYRLAVTFADEAERDAFRRDCLNGCSFSEWVYTRWNDEKIQDV
jgi:hypothetical protein